MKAHTLRCYTMALIIIAVVCYYYFTNGKSDDSRGITKLFQLQSATTLQTLRGRLSTIFFFSFSFFFFFFLFPFLIFPLLYFFPTSGIDKLVFTIRNFTRASTSKIQIILTQQFYTRCSTFKFFTIRFIIFFSSIVYTVSCVCNGVFSLLFLLFIYSLSVKEWREAKKKWISKNVGNKLCKWKKMMKIVKQLNVAVATV